MKKCEHCERVFSLVFYAKCPKCFSFHAKKTDNERREKVQQEDQRKQNVLRLVF